MEAKENGPNGKHSGRVQVMDGPTNPMVTPLLTDLYQFTMAYAYWKAGKHHERAVFDLYFRKNPFGGEYTIFAGLEECIRFIANFKFTEEEISFIHQTLPSSCEDGFYDYLRGIDCADVEVYSVSEGSVVFPKVPLLRVEGPIAVVQLLETPLVNLINYPSLVATNAARHRFVAGKSKMLLEFGLRRAQGPDGGIGASKYCYIGGFDATRISGFKGGAAFGLTVLVTLVIENLLCNVAAGKLFGIPLRGTHSHAFVSSFMSPDEIIDKSLHSSDGSNVCEDFVSRVQTWLSKIQWSISLRGVFGETNQSELAAFTSYALAFPANFLALVDTYDVIRSGIPNFCAVALALSDLGYKAAGIRLDSGDLAYLSCETRKFFVAIEKEFGVPGFGSMSITASNDLNEETLDALNKQGHEVDAFGIGTYLVTCYAQAALGCVFKLVEINNQPRIKLSEDVSKVSIPCKKRCYRLYGKEGYPLVDIMTGENEPPPKVGERILCRHPFNESKRAYVVPQRVEELLKCYWPGKTDKAREDLPPLKDIRERCIKQLEQMRPDHMRRLNPTPYKVLDSSLNFHTDFQLLATTNSYWKRLNYLNGKQVSVSAKLYDFIHFLWLNEAPVGELQ
ncbi:Nicotinate phosphoribosyltransferase [Morella rubra]|uniref:nicotinate phosphoribosyltransferase n=1 Tax=Morella rubra TaxID=262757 RepID=A0A6A1VPS5_9ROSI|nr:Nicotinate phosphoribosyltransferase [Morella rubra]